MLIIGFGAVSDFFFGGERSYQKAWGGEAVGELFFFCTHIFGQSFLLNYMCFFSPRSC